VILAEHGLICPLCEDDHTPIDLSAKWPAPNSLTWEHILAIDAGGPHATENIVPAHARCNLIKGKKILTPELREYIKARKKELDSADARKRLVST
jgi:5-methylcytosine-specific restriction endonuclease McrA